MKKFAAIFAAVILTVSVFMVSASAKLFSDDTQYEYSGLVQHVTTVGSGWSANAISSVISFQVVRDGSVVFTYGFPEPVKLFRNSHPSDYTPVIQPVFVGYVDNSTRYNVYPSEPIYFSDTIIVTSLSGDPFTNFTVTSVSVPGAVSSLSGSVFDVGDSLIAFVQSSWLTLVALGAFLVVLCIGAIRRLVKGV